MIVVLRLGHRPSRDKRVTTHVALTARALGADEVWVTTKDPALEKTITAMVARFGGSFSVRTGVRWKEAIRSWKGTVVHLTMYGERLDEAMRSIGRDGGKDLLVVVGAEKVPRDVYDLADHNVSVGNQPHSEIAALAIFLYALTDDGSLYRSLEGSRMTVVPDPRGKTVVDESRRRTDGPAEPR